LSSQGVPESHDFVPIEPQSGGKQRCQRHGHRDFAEKLSVGISQIPYTLAAKQ
jgi:hypothetical protein